MSIVTLLEKNEADASVQPIYDKTESHFGHVPNLVKALANNPTLCTSISNFLVQSLGEGRIDRNFKELIIIKTLLDMRSDYSVQAHIEWAKQLGESEERIRTLPGELWKSSSNYSDGEMAVLRLIEQIAIDPNDVGDDIWKPLKSHWDNGQLLEITSVITTFLAIGRIGDSLQVNEEVLFSK